MSRVDERILAKVLESCDFVDFAVLFGSAATGRLLPVSDVDVGIYTTRKISLEELGELIGRLEKAAGRPVDVVVVNDLPRVNPPLAFESVVRGRLLFARNMSRYIEFKARCMMAYMDTEYLRRMVDEAFRRRVATGDIGKLPHHGTGATETA